MYAIYFRNVHENRIQNSIPVQLHLFYSVKFAICEFLLSHKRFLGVNEQQGNMT